MKIYKLNNNKQKNYDNPYKISNKQVKTLRFLIKEGFLTYGFIT